MGNPKTKWVRDDFGTARERRKKKARAPFFQLWRYMTKSDAWYALTGEEIAAFVEFASVYNGANNGRLSVPVKALAAKRDISPDTASVAIRGLVAKGFIERTKASAFNVKNRQAAEYRLTMFRCDVTGEPPGKAFMRWQPDRTPRNASAKRHRQPNGRFAARRLTVTTAW